MSEEKPPWDRNPIENWTIFDEGGIYPAHEAQLYEYKTAFIRNDGNPATPAEHIYRRQLMLLNLLFGINRGKDPTNRYVIETQISAICECLRIALQEIQIQKGVKTVDEIKTAEQKRPVIIKPKRVREKDGSLR
jgi:hypothetical protein